MSYVIRNFTAVPDELPMHELYRYMGIGRSVVENELHARVMELLPQFMAKLRCKACWVDVPVSVAEGLADLDLVKMESQDLARALAGCDRAVIFAATIGADVDRLCRTASITAPANAVIYDAMGTTAIEWLCDTLCHAFTEMYSEYVIRPRFSPGYGDLSLTLQIDLLRILDAYRQIGLTLSDSLMMVPQKSVTAIVGLKRNKTHEEEKV